MQIKLLTLDGWFIVCSISAIMVSLHNNSLSSAWVCHHMVLFLVLINPECQDHVRLGVMLGTGGCSVAVSSAFPRSLLRDRLSRTPQIMLVPLYKGVSFGKQHIKTKSFFWVWDLVMHAVPGGLGAWLEAQQGALAMAHAKQWAGVSITIAWA